MKSIYYGVSSLAQPANGITTIPNHASAAVNCAARPVAKIGTAAFLVLGLGLAAVTCASSLAHETVGPVTHASPPHSILELAVFTQAGRGSWYGGWHQGRKTASGERFNMYQMTAAHPKLPLGTIVRVTNPANGKSVKVRINDRGPYVKGRVIDLSAAAARALGISAKGTARLRIEAFASDQIPG